jgi:hypothetical protein
MQQQQQQQLMMQQNKSADAQQQPKFVFNVETDKSSRPSLQFVFQVPTVQQQPGQQVTSPPTAAIITTQQQQPNVITSCILQQHQNFDQNLMQSQKSIAATTTTTTTPGNVSTKKIQDKLLRKDKSRNPAVRPVPAGQQAAGYPANRNGECFLCCNIFFIRLSNIFIANVVLNIRLDW